MCFSFIDESSCRAISVYMQSIDGQAESNNPDIVIEFLRIANVSSFLGHKALRSRLRICRSSESKLVLALSKLAVPLEFKLLKQPSQSDLDILNSFPKMKPSYRIKFRNRKEMRFVADQKAPFFARLRRRLARLVNVGVTSTRVSFKSTSLFAVARRVVTSCLLLSASCRSSSSPWTNYAKSITQ